MVEVRRPGDATDGQARDMLGPTREFLNGLGLLPVAGHPERTEGEPDKTDNELQITKSAGAWSRVVTGAGAGTPILGGILSATNSVSESIAIALIAAGTIIVAAGIYGIARVTDGDVRARGSRATEAMTARATVVAALIKSFDTTVPSQEVRPCDVDKASTVGLNRDGHGDQLDLLMTAVASGAPVKVSTSAGEDVVSAFRWTEGNGVEVFLRKAQDYVSPSQIRAFHTRR